VDGGAIEMDGGAIGGFGGDEWGEVEFVTMEVEKRERILSLIGFFFIKNKCFIYFQISTIQSFLPHVIHPNPK
jgi:hypothetical protein